MGYYEYITKIRNNRDNVRFVHSERHHIIPKCLGGTDEPDNLIYLTQREHLLAHKYLALEHPKDRKLVLAYWKMFQGRDCYSEEEYEDAKYWMLHLPKPESFRKYISEANKINKKGNKNFLGKHHSEATKEKIRQAKLGKTHTCSEETKRKISESNKGRVGGMQGKKHSEETRRKMSESAKARHAELNFKGERRCTNNEF